MIEPRPYQVALLAEVRARWAGGHVPLLVLPTGGGKTVIFAKAIADEIAAGGSVCAIAHRRELVGQISLMLARFGVRHAIEAPRSVIAYIVASHVREVGASFYSPTAPARVASVDTLQARSVEPWRGRVTLLVLDEGHHTLRDNKWGRAAGTFPRARIVGVTATPKRADGRGLGRDDGEGIYTCLVVGPSGRELMDGGYLTDYIVYAPETLVNLAKVPISQATGDYSRKKLDDALRNSSIVGDMVESYLKFGAGKRGVSFVTSVDLTEHMADEYRRAGVPALAVSAQTPDAERDAAVRKLREGSVLQLVNVDLFGEGFDLPAIETVSFGRHTQSLGLFLQQFGRALRPMPGKSRAIIIDHVGNVVRHRGGPDYHRPWSLRSTRGSKKTAEGPEPRVCGQCTAVYPREHWACPHCGHEPVILRRDGPAHVEGNLLELTPDVLASLRGDVADMDKPPETRAAELAHCSPVIQGRQVKLHRANQGAQEMLRRAISHWAGWRREQGHDDASSYRAFHTQFGVDVLSAQTLKVADATNLWERIRASAPDGKIPI